MGYLSSLAKLSTDRISNFVHAGRNDEINRLRKLVQASYYAATSESPSIDFSFAGSESINDALKTDLNTLRNRIRYELRQNGPAKGMLKTYANSCVSTGPTLSIDSINKAWSENAERAFSVWASQAGYNCGQSLGELLHLYVRQFFVAGEFFNVYKSDKSSKNPVKLKLMPIRPDRVASPFSYNNNSFAGITIIDGKPSSYSILQPSGVSSGISQGVGDYKDESAENVSHVFIYDEPEQIRGEPWLAAGLPDLHKKRRYDEARVAAAVVAAKFAVFITANSDEIDADDILPEGVVELNDGAATVLPRGYNIQSFAGNQPVAGATDFRREMVANAGAAAGMSSNAANNDSGNSNFASARYDDVGFSLEQGVTRAIIANRFLNVVAEKWIKEAYAVRAIGAPPADYRFIWRWPMAGRHTDPLKAANANAKRLASGEATLATIWAEQGIDKEEGRAGLLDDVDWFYSNNLIHPLINTVEPVNDNNQDDEDENEIDNNDK